MKQSGRNSVLLWVFLVALGVNGALGLALGFAKPMASDSYYFLSIAKSLAQGEGFVFPEGFWGHVPTMSRSPGWPFAISLALRLAPGLSPDVVMRGFNLLLNSLVAGLVAGLGRKVIRYWLVGSGRNEPSGDEEKIANNAARIGAFFAGIFYVFYPIALYEAYEGTSEILFLALALGGTLLLLSGGRNPCELRLPWKQCAGFLLLGISCLVRANFILWIGFLGVMVLGYLVWSIGRRRSQKIQVHVCAAAAPKTPLRAARLSVQILFLVFLFLLPPLLWAVRNYRVCGHIPVFSTLRGQTFYGGNNEVVAKRGAYWGYWIFPNSIPGETPMVDLAKTMSEYEVDCYYTGKGKAYIRNHLSAMPGLCLGKLVRAYVPVPWKFSVGSAVVSLFRALLWGLAIWGLVLAWRTVMVEFRIILAAMMLTNVVMILMFWGCARFTFAVEPFFIPLAVVAVMRVINLRKSS